MIYLEAWKDGGGAHAESEHVGDRGDGDGHSGVLIDSKANIFTIVILQMKFLVSWSYSRIIDCVEGET